MSEWLRGQTGRIYVVLRIVSGVLFACHGAQKLFGVLGSDGVPLLSQVGLAGVIEFFGGGLIALGLFTPYVAVIASGEMAFAYFLAHVYRLRVLGQWFDGIRIYAAASSPTRSRRTCAGRWCAETSVRRGPGHRDGRRGMIST